ncbi:hypothetical protein A2U01_0094482, partial [Trifolium medium]|nr:hypothetical protein [Trifolium medium]
MLVVRRCFVSIVAKEVTRARRAGSQGWLDEEFVPELFL